MSAGTFSDRTAGRRNNFDFLRFVLATLVIVSHSFILLQGDNSREFLMRITGGQITGGEFAVNGFFVLSGFLIAQSWENSRSAASYFQKRLRRIYPGFLVAVCFCALVIAPLIASSASAYWQQFKPLTSFLWSLNLDLDLPRVFGNLPVHDVNGSLWTIRYEFFCYIGVAFLGLLGAFRRKWIVVAAFALSLVLYALQIYRNMYMPGSSLSRLYCYPGFWPRLAAFFLAGMLFYLYRQRIPYSRGLLLAAMAGVGFFTVASELKFLPLALTILGPYLLFYFAFLPTPRLHRFAARGDFSYGIYLYAFPIQQLLVHWCGSSLNPFTLFLLAFPLTGLLAVLSWSFVEKRFLATKPRPAACGIALGLHPDGLKQTLPSAIMKERLL